MFKNMLAARTVGASLFSESALSCGDEEVPHTPPIRRLISRVIERIGLAPAGLFFCELLLTISINTIILDLFGRIYL